MTAQLKGLARLLSGFHEIDPASVFLSLARGFALLIPPDLVS